VDYIHSHVSPGRAEMIKDLGAVVIRIDGEYEASVERAKEDARMNGWHFVSSTSWGDFDNGIPQNVMNAYMVVVEEALQAIPAVENITHVFVCGGVGSIAAAVFQESSLASLRTSSQTKAES
jgi:diaminopropionate ammonia-lyase